MVQSSLKIYTWPCKICELHYETTTKRPGDDKEALTVMLLHCMCPKHRFAFQLIAEGHLLHTHTVIFSSPFTLSCN